jgi:hypothetical protein
MRPVDSKYCASSIPPAPRIALGRLLADVEPDADGHRPSDDVADRLQDLGREATPVLERAAVSVGSVVRIRRQEPLVHVVVVEVQLESVGSALQGQPSGICVFADELGDVGVGHHVRDEIDDRGAQRADGACGIPPWWTICTLTVAPSACKASEKAWTRSTK